MNYVDEGGLLYDIASCDYFPESKVHYGFPISEQCTCNTCDKNCHYDNNPTMSVFEGFGFVKVLIVYIFVTLSTMIIYFIKRNKNVDYERSRASTVSGYSINENQIDNNRNLIDN